MSKSIRTIFHRRKPSQQSQPPQPTQPQQPPKPEGFTPGWSFDSGFAEYESYVPLAKQLQLQEEQKQQETLAKETQTEIIPSYTQATSYYHDNHPPPLHLSQSTDKDNNTSSISNADNVTISLITTLFLLQKPSTKSSRQAATIEDLRQRLSTASIAVLNHIIHTSRSAHAKKNGLGGLGLPGMGIVKGGDELVHIAARHGNLHAVKWLLDMGGIGSAGIRKGNWEGDTAGHIAAAYTANANIEGDKIAFEIVNLLSSYSEHESGKKTDDEVMIVGNHRIPLYPDLDSDTDPIEDDNYTTYPPAQSRRQAPVQHNQKLIPIVDIRNNLHQTPLFAAVGAGNISVIRLLLENGAKIDVCDANSETVFLLAERMIQDERKRENLLRLLTGSSLGANNNGT